MSYPVPRLSSRSRVCRKSLLYPSYLWKSVKSVGDRLCRGSMRLETQCGACANAVLFMCYCSALRWPTQCSSFLPPSSFVADDLLSPADSTSIAELFAPSFATLPVCVSRSALWGDTFSQFSSLATALVCPSCGASFRGLMHFLLGTQAVFCANLHN